MCRAIGRDFVRGCRIAHLADLDSFGGPGREAHYPPDLRLEPCHIKIEAKLDIPKRELEGTVTLTIEANQGKAKSITLDAVDFHELKVRDQDDQTLNWSYDGQQIKVTWDKPFTKGEQRRLVVTYKIIDPVGGLYFSSPDQGDPSRPLYVTTDHETELARYWLPCIDHPSVRTTLEFHLTAAEQLVALANGMEVDQDRSDTKGQSQQNGSVDSTKEGGLKTTSWKLEQLCPSYLICFTIGDFARFDDQPFEGRPLSYFSSKDFSPADLERSFGRTKDMLQWMTKKLQHEFPYPKYFQFAVPGMGGAMENISLVSWAEYFILDERFAPEFTWLTDQVNVHEMAHSYFGDLIVCRDHSHAWLKESWATYMETCWLEDQKGQDEANYDIFRNTEAYIDEAESSYARPIVTRNYTSSWQMFDRHLYPGGAVRLHTLRKEVGDGVFWSGVQDYVKSYAGKLVETDDFRRILERHSSRSLQQFFDQWFHGLGFPDLAVGFSYDRDKKMGTWTIEQKQVKKQTAKSKDHESQDQVPVFEFHTTVAWMSGETTEYRRLLIDQAKMQFSFPMAIEPDHLRFDAYSEVLHRLEFNPGVEKLKHQLANDTNVVGRIHAATTLVKHGRKAGLVAVIAHYSNEPFWGVRCEILKVLGQTGTTSALEALLDIVGTEQDPLVLPAVFAAIAEYRDPQIITGVTKVLEDRQLGYLATSKAYLALGAQRAAAPLDLLKDAANQSRTGHAFDVAGALTGLGKSRQEEAAGYLLEKTYPGALPLRARTHPVKALGELALYLPKPLQMQVEDRLIDLLRSDDQEMALAAVQALGQARVGRAKSALQTLKKRLPKQVGLDIDSAIAKINEGQDGAVKAVKKEVDDLKETLRKLSDRLLDVEARTVPTEEG